MQDRDRDRDTERTTIVHTAGDGGSSSGILIALVVLVLLAVLGFLLFGGSLGRGADEGDVNVNIEAPDVTLPEVQIPEVQVPEVNVNVQERDEPNRETENQTQ